MRTRTRMCMRTRACTRACMRARARAYARAYARTHAHMHAHAHAHADSLTRGVSTKMVSTKMVSTKMGELREMTWFAAREVALSLHSFASFTLFSPCTSLSPSSLPVLFRLIRLFQRQKQRLLIRDVSNCPMGLLRLVGSSPLCAQIIGLFRRKQSIL